MTCFGCIMLHFGVFHYSFGHVLQSLDVFVPSLDVSVITEQNICIMAILLEDYVLTSVVIYL